MRENIISSPVCALLRGREEEETTAIPYILKRLSHTLFAIEETNG